MDKLIAPAAIIALKEALVAVYWYKKDLRGFILQALPECSILSQVNWNDYKRNIVSTIVDHLAKHQDRFQSQLLNLMRDVTRIDDFSHLRRLDGGEAKAKIAENAMRALRKLVEPHEQLVIEMEDSAKRRREANVRLEQARAVNKELEDLKREFCAMVSLKDHQARGYKLEKVLKGLFDIFDLDPKASFKLDAEQIDGAFTFDSNEYLLEAKWQVEPVDLAALDGFHAKLTRKLDNTLGLFISINGFSSNAMRAHPMGSRTMALFLDGAHLMAVLEGRLDLTELLSRIKRHAATTGEVYLPINKILVK